MQNMSEHAFAVIGYPIGHTMSPFIHEKLFALAGKTASYGVYQVAPEELEEFAAGALSHLDGYNVTIPHKEAVMQYLDDFDPKARLYGSVNTVKCGKRKIGYTTDPEGFTRALENAHIPLAGHCVILGCGGVARVMAVEAALAGCRVTIASRAQSIARAQKLCADVCRIVPDASVSICGMDQVGGEIDLLVNATPVGMYPRVEESPVPLEALRKTANLFDAIYNPDKTKLMQMAASAGARVLGGMPMLVWQAAVAQGIWNGSSFLPRDIDNLCKAAEEEVRRRFSK